MLTVDVEKRMTIDQCLEHPWTTGRVGGPPGKDGVINPGESMGSTDGLTGAMGKLDFSLRKPVRERTLLSAINDVGVTKVIHVGGKDEEEKVAVKVWEKNQVGGAKKSSSDEKTPAHDRDPNEFIKMGGKGDQPLFGDDVGSHYQDQSMKQVKE